MTIQDDAIALLRAEAAAILGLADTVDGSFTAAVEQIAATVGRVIISGLGKSWHVGQKISADGNIIGTWGIRQGMPRDVICQCWKQDIHTP